MITDLLKDKVAIVTGGTRGIGYSVVKAFLDQGARVILFGSRQETADQAVAKLLEENSSYPVSGLAPVLHDCASVSAAIEAIIKDFGHIDILVNNAGISASSSIYEYKESDFDQILELNIKSIFACTRAVAPYMRDQGGGVILNTSSMVSLYGQPRGCGYPASKFAVNGLTKSLARELGPDQIRVNAVAPGVTKTDMVKNLPEETVKRISSTIPLDRPAEPEDIANAFLFLASDYASYISGTILSVDGATIV